jgi:hypothetical protein
MHRTYLITAVKEFRKNINHVLREGGIAYKFSDLNIPIKVEMEKLQVP